MILSLSLFYAYPVYSVTEQHQFPHYSTFDAENMSGKMSKYGDLC